MTLLNERKPTTLNPSSTLETVSEAKERGCILIVLPKRSSRVTVI